MEVMSKVNLRSSILWLWDRREVVIPVLGLPLVFAMLGGGIDTQLGPVQSVWLGALALIYAGMVLWSPMGLPDKEPQPLSRARIIRSVATVVICLVLAVALQMTLHQSSSQSSSNGARYLCYLLLSVVVGSAGVVAEQTLPVDLFPLIRQKDIRRLVYAVAAAVFLMMFLMLCNGVLIEPLSHSIGQAFGESPLPEKEALDHFDGYTNPVSLFVIHLISAGFEEFLFRVGFLTLIWGLTHRWGLGLLCSSICFGLYHITLSGMSGYFLQAPIIAVLSTAGMGALNALIYRYRGFSTAVLVHAVGNWLFMALMMYGG